MKSEEVLNTMGIEKDTYPADAVFERFNLIGTYSKDRKTVCLMIEDNVDEVLQEDIENCILGMEAVKEIALTVDNLITNFGCAVHSHTLKSNKAFDNFKIIPASTF